MSDENSLEPQQAQTPPPDPQTIVDQKPRTSDSSPSAMQQNTPNMDQNHQTTAIKKPFYKKWWFWVIIAVVVIGIIGVASGESSSESNTATSSSATSSTSSISSQPSTPATDSEKAELEDAIVAAKAIDITQYTDATASTLSTAISNAEKVYDYADATSDQVKNAISSLSSAQASLKEKEKPVVLSGSGDDVVDIPTNLATCLVTAEYNGKSNFAIWSLDKNGDHIDLLVNTIGAYSGTTTTGMRNATAAFLEISASGPWTITLTPIADTPVMTSGQPMHGDKVVKVNTGTATKLTITNTGKSNFVVHGVSSSTSKLLVNEIGNYSGTVVNSNFTMFIVKSEGDWTISW